MKKPAPETGILPSWFFLIIGVIFISSSFAGISGALTINTDKTLADTTITASSTDASAILVTQDGNLSITNSTITTSGETSSDDSSSFYGLNAGILAVKGSTITTLSR